MVKEISNEELIRKVEEEVATNIAYTRPILENNLYKFNKFILKVEEGKDKVSLAPFHKEMCDFVMRRRKRKKKLILTPRGHLKSTVITIGRSLQAIVTDPSVRILIANATYNLACSFLTEVKRHLKFNKTLHMFWGDLTRNAETWSWNDITLTTAKGMRGKKEPTVTTMGIESNMTSQHYDLIILDDLVNKDYINTQDQIQKSIDFYKECLNLLEPNGELIVIGTRWHDSDLYGWIMDTDNNVISDFDVFSRKAYEGNLEGSDFKALFPDKFSQKHLLKLYEQQGPYFFSCQYMNDPIPEKDAVFKKDWFLYYEPLDLRGMTLNHFTLVDPAISLEKDADYTAIVTIAIDQFRNIYLREIVRQRMPPSEIINHLFRIWEQYHPLEFGLEDVAYQKALQYSLSEEMHRRQVYLPIKQVKPANRSKDQRIKGLQPLYFNQKILHAKIIKNMKYLEDELLRFPRGKHDDIIDALSYMLDIAYPPRRKISRPYDQRWLYP